MRFIRREDSHGGHAPSGAAWVRSFHPYSEAIMADKKDMATEGEKDRIKAR